MTIFFIILVSASIICVFKLYKNWKKDPPGHPDDWSDEDWKKFGGKE